MKTLVEIRTGPPPALLCTPPSGTLLAEFTLPIKHAVAEATGKAEHVAVYRGSACLMVAPVSLPGGGGSMVLDNVMITEGQVVQLTSFVLKDRHGATIDEL